MDTNEISRLLRRSTACGKRVKGVFPCNLLPFLRSKELAVVNMDVHTKPGTHWVVVGSNDEYFDPLGLPLTNQFIRNKLKSNGRVWTNKYPVQSVITNVCGEFCVFYCIMRCRNVSPSKIVTRLFAMSNPDVFVYNYVRGLGK